MRDIDRVFVALDLKSLTNTVLSYAVWLCEIMECKTVTLFHIMEYTLTPPAYLIPYINKEKLKVEEKLKVFSEMLNKFTISSDYRVVFGRLVESLKEVVKSENSLVVMGFKTHITRPSTSERILKGLKVPVFIVKKEVFDDIKPQDILIKNILCPIDFSENSLRAFFVAKNISHRCKANLKLLHVVPEQKIKTIIEEPEEIKKYIKYLKEEAEEKFIKIDQTIEHEVLSGIPAEEILKKIKNADLVVIGSKGRSYSESVILGSVAEAVIKNSDKPVLLIP